MNSCYYCECTDKEFRPYGPNGSMICFDCAMATPERMEQTEHNFISQLEAAGPIAVIGTEAGPYPFKGVRS